jgi:ankyrin repeat protein
MALMWAAEKGHTATVQALIGAGADLNLQGKVSGCDSSCRRLRCRERKV